MVLSRGDDYPIHQRSEPVAYAGTDRNFYDRYFFNGYACDGSGFFALAYGVYPALDIADAHFSFIRGDTQYCLHASTVMNMERMMLEVGPISIKVIEPLQCLRLSVAPEAGIAAELTFAARSAPIEEPRFTHRIGSQMFMDYTRMTQNGHYTGWIECDGARVDLARGSCGTRDRSWGIRPIGARDPQPNPHSPSPQFFWQWTPINLGDASLFFHINADAQGRSWNSRAAFARDGASPAQIVEGEGRIETSLQSGTRWPQRAALSLNVEGAPQRLDLEPVARFQMKGLGYTHPKWGHGLCHGQSAVEREDIALDALDPLAPENLHVQMLCRVGGREAQAMGVFEQLIIGPYAPLGLKQFLDGAG